MTGVLIIHCGELCEYSNHITMVSVNLLPAVPAAPWGTFYLLECQRQGDDPCYTHLVFFYEVDMLSFQGSFNILWVSNQRQLH
jgi:hypothetical protein